MKGVRETLVVEIDAKATALVRRHLKGRSFAERYGDDPRAVVSAAVCFLFTEDADGHGELTEAIDRLERRVGRAVVQQHPPVDVPIDVEAAGLLARYARKSGLDPRDVASGAVYCLMASLLNIGTFTSTDCIRSAQARRLSRAERVRSEGKKPKAAPKTKTMPVFDMADPEWPAKLKAWQQRQRQQPKGEA